MSLPTEDDFKVFNSLDEMTASRHFLNKSLSEAEALFRSNSLTYCHDLMWVGPKAFDFYLEAMFNYLKSDDAIGDNDIVNGILTVVEYRRNDEELPSAVARVRVIIGYVVANYDKFDVDHTIYGNLLEKHTALLDRLSRISDGARDPRLP